MAPFLDIDLRTFDVKNLVWPRRPFLEGEASVAMQ